MKAKTRFINRQPGIRSLLTIFLMIGAFLVVHGLLMRITIGGHLFEFLLGIVISVVTIAMAAIPSK